MDKLNK